MIQVKYVCPECGSEGQFTETWNQTWESTGSFNKEGDIEDPDPQALDTYTEYYNCLDCGDSFDRPKKVEEDDGE